MLPDILAAEFGSLAAREVRELRLVVAAALAEMREQLESLRAKSAEIELRADKRITARLATVQDGACGPRGEPGESITGAPGVDGRDGKDGVDGAPGAFLEPRQWTEGIHYRAALVIHRGSTWYARRDTASEPPGDDWLCVAAAGEEGLPALSFTIRGTWNERDEYLRLDVVALNGASFAARRDRPGPCPGDGWQMIASQGKAGKPGDRGERGPPGARVAAATIDNDGLLTLRHDDGSTITCDLYPVLSRIAQ